MFHRIKNVCVMPEMQLLVEFVNGEQKRYDVKPLIGKLKSFQPLESVVGLFNKAKVDVGGYGVIWNDEIDLSSEELWDNGIPEERNDVNLL